MLIRDETGDDAAAIRSVVAAAFGREVEADLVDALRSSGDAIVSMVAEDEGGIVGHVLLSKLHSPEGCLALAPVSVAPDRQNRGVGSRLVGEVLRQAKNAGWRAAFVVGEPAYYGRFGFSAAPDNFEAPYGRHFFMALALAPGGLDGPAGRLIYAPPFRTLDPA